MADYLYLVMNICVFLPLFLASTFNLFGIKVKREIVYSFLLISLPFIVWDVIVTWLGHWSFSEKYTLGFSILGIPFEEFLFFFSVPYGCIYVWEALRKFNPKTNNSSELLSRISTFILITFGIFLIIAGGDYSHIAGALLIVTSVAGYYLGWLGRYDFWRFQVILYCLFIGFNLILTSLPVVSYSVDAILGFRFITIPIEDFAYNFILINSSLFVYEKYLSK